MTEKNDLQSRLKDSTENLQDLNLELTAKSSTIESLEGSLEGECQEKETAFGKIVDLETKLGDTGTVLADVQEKISNID